MAKKYQILIADDEESITFLLQTELEEFPEYEVDTALNGTEAINLIQSKPYDVALLDIKMPRVSGLEVLKFITEPNPAGSTMLRWEIQDPVKPGEGGVLRFRTRAR